MSHLKIPCAPKSIKEGPTGQPSHTRNLEVPLPCSRLALKAADIVPLNYIDPSQFMTWYVTNNEAFWSVRSPWAYKREGAMYGVTCRCQTPLAVEAVCDLVGGEV